MEELTTGQNTNQEMPGGGPTYPPTPPPIRPRPAMPLQPTANAVPPPPATPDAAVRTMASDAASMAKNGGGEPEPQFVKFPTADATPQGAATELPPPPSNGTGRAVLWLIGLILIVAGGWAAYAYVLPMYRAPQEAAPAAEPGVAAFEPTPAAVPAATEAPSLFGTPAANIVRVMTDATPSGIIAALAGEAKMKPASGNMKEVLMATSAGNMTFAQFIGTLLPEAQKPEVLSAIAGSVRPDFAAYLYYDENGIWPGYVAKIDPAHAADMVTLTANLQKLESASYANFFLSAPGAASAFRTGQAGKYANRFAPFSGPGASFNYGIFGDYVIINTSYGGLMQALAALKLE